MPLSSAGILARSRGPPTLDHAEHNAVQRRRKHDAEPALVRIGRLRNLTLTSYGRQIRAKALLAINPATTLAIIATG